MNTKNLDFYFFDTSALIKQYHEERGSRIVDEIMKEENNVIVISNLTIIETTSAFVRKKNEKKISQSELDIVLSKLYSDVIKKYMIIELNEIHFKKSLDFILKNNLRTLDSLQLAAADDIRNLKPIFVCADKKLCNTSEKYFEIINPEENC